MKKRMLPLLALLMGLGACTSSTGKIITAETVTAQSLGLTGTVQSIITMPDSAYHHGEATADCCCGEEGLLDHLKQEQTFDKAGRLLEEKYVNEAGEVEQTTKMSYDEAGRLTERKTTGVETWMNITKLYFYDKEGRLIELKTQNSGEPAYSEHYHYNSAGLLDTLRRTGEDLPTNRIEAFGYDSKGRRTTKSMFDSEGALILKILDEYNELDSVSKSITEVPGSDQLTTYTYNKKGKLERSVLTANGTLIEEASYTYDDKGRITRHFIKRTNGDGNEETTYEYGENGLVKEKFNGPYSMYLTTYKRDKQGNWTERTLHDPETGAISSRYTRTIKYY